MPAISAIVSAPHLLALAVKSRDLGPDRSTSSLPASGGCNTLMRLLNAPERFPTNP